MSTRLLLPKKLFSRNKINIIAVKPIDKTQNIKYNNTTLPILSEN